MQNTGEKMSMRTATITVSTVQQKLHAALYSLTIETVNGKTAMLRVLKDDLKLLHGTNSSYQYEYSLHVDKVENTQFGQPGFRDDVIEKLMRVFGNPAHLEFKVSKGLTEIPTVLSASDNEWIVFNEEGNTGITITIK